MSLLPPVFVELKANASEFMSAMDEANKKVAELGEKGASTGQKIKEHMGQGLMAAGAAATGAGALLFEMGEKVERSQKDLETAIDNTGTSYEEYGKKISQTVGHEEKFGHTADDSKEALAVLTRATGDAGKALEDMDLVTQIAAVHHSSLADAAEMVAKMHAGSTKALKEFGINVKDAGQASKDQAAALKEVQAADTAEADAASRLSDMHEKLAGKKKLTTSETIALRNAEAKAQDATDRAKDAHERYSKAMQETGEKIDFATEKTMLLAKIHGTAEAQADTFGGKISALKAHFTDMAASIGQKLGPAMVTVGPLMAGLGGIIQSGVLPMVAKAVVGFGSMAAGAVASFASMIAGAATWAASMVASAAVALAPFLPIIAVFAAVAFAAYELYEHWDEVMSFLKSAAGKAVDGIKAAFDAAIDFVKSIPGRILDALKAVPGMLVTVGQDMIHGLYDGIVAYFKVVEFFYVKIPEKILGFFFGAAKWLLDVGSDIIHGLYDGIVAYFKVVEFFYVQLPIKIAGFFADALHWLFDAGGKIIHGLYDGLRWVWDHEIAGLLNIGRWVSDIVGNLDRVLWDAGRAVIKGLIDGIGSMFGSVKDTLGNLTSKLTSWKGPEDVDATILRPAGQSVIQGFINGLNDKIPSVKSALEGVTGIVADAGQNIADQFGPDTLAGKTMASIFAPGGLTATAADGRMISGLSFADAVNIATPGSGYHLTSQLPSYDVGGVVPGPMGAPQLALVHGGEQVLTPAQRQATAAPQINLTVNAGMGADGGDIGRKVVDALREYMRQNGPVPITTRVA